MQQTGSALATIDRGAKKAITEDQRKEWQRIQDAVGPILMELNKLASDAVTARGPTEERWLKNLRQYHGIYESQIKGALGEDEDRSKIFINITRPKTLAWAARLGDMLFPNDERNWGIDPTPVPELSANAREIAKLAEQAEAQAQGMADEHNAAVEAGMPPDPAHLEQATKAAEIAVQLRAKEKQQQAEMELAKKRAKAMENLIHDQLVESNYPARCRDVIDDMTKVGVGIVKGPITGGKGRRKWELQPIPDSDKTTATLKTENDMVPRYRRVNYWHFFPEPSAESMEECEYTFERHLPNKKMLRKMAKELGFHPAAVSELIKEGSRGAGASDLNFLTELRTIESTGIAQSTSQALSDRYVVWEYHGPLEAEQVAAMLRATGRFEDADRVEDSDQLEVPMVRVFFCSDRLLKIEEDYHLDSCELIYSVATFEKGEATVLGGVGVPHLMANEQSMLNSAIRMMMDNAALAVAPQVIIDKEQIEPENGKWKLAPRKIWQWIRAAGVQAREKPFDTFDIPMNQEMLAAIIQLAVKFVDEAVSMPLIAQGEMGAHVTKTSSGMSMLFNSANVIFRRVVKHWDDDITTGTITRAYDFNMQFSDREEVKGDMKVQARGTSVLLVREMQAEQLMQLIREWAAHPILGVGFRAYHAMRLVLQAMSINPDDLLLSEEDYLNKLKQMAESGGEESPETVRVQGQIQVAQIDAQSRQQVADVNRQIAEIRAQTAFAELASNRDISLEQIKAMFQTSLISEQNKAAIEQGKQASSERQLAVEVAIERENARKAEAQGREPTGSGGAISMGSEAA